MSDPAPTPTPTTPKGRGKRLATAAALLFCLSSLLFAEYSLSRRDPSWWRPINASDAGAEAQAEQVEDGVVAHATLARPGDPAFREYRSQEWSVSLSEDDANAWLATRLKAWMGNRGTKWPAEVGDVQARFEEGAVRLGVRLQRDGVSQVVSALVVPSIHADGSLWLEARGMSIGRAPLPAGLVLSRLPKMGSQAQTFLDALAGKKSAVQEPILKLEDGRIVRLVGIAAHDGRVEVRCRTEKK